jgi:hypothetical protein
MALQPPFDQAVKPILQSFGKFSGKISELQNQLLDRVNQVVSKVADLPNNIKCSDPRVLEIKNLLNSINNIIDSIESLFSNLSNVVNTLIAIATVSAILIGVLSVSPVPLPLGTPQPIFNKTLEVASYVVATILGILGTIKIIISVVIKRVTKVPEQLNAALEKLQNICSNDIINLKTNGSDDQINNIAQAIQEYEDATGTDFYKPKNVSAEDQQQRQQQIETLIQQQRSLIDNLIELPSNVYRETGQPDTELGTQGDYYIDTTTNTIYGPKPTDTNWGTPLN